jgi:hypothetical protein
LLTGELNCLGVGCECEGSESDFHLKSYLIISFNKPRLLNRRNQFRSFS